ncbi:MAG: hypothetical protein KUG72_10660 [Pseudomonadales bacterium]|nr:hypothetical protein [Pseudomonadales bacterium]
MPDIMKIDQPKNPEFIKNIMDPYFLVSQKNQISFLKIIEICDNGSLLKQQIISLLNYRIKEDDHRLLDHVRRIVIYSEYEEEHANVYDAVYELFSVLENKGTHLKVSMFRLVKTYLTKEQEDQLNHIVKLI